MDLQGLLHNKWVWAGGAVAGGAGLIVFLRKRAAGGTPAAASAGSQSTPAYASGSVGGFDSTGTDVASWLGNYSANLDNQLKGYQQQLSDALGGLGQIPTGTTGTGSGPAAAVYKDIAPNQNLYEVGDLNVLRSLNPGLDKAITWLPTGANKTPILTTRQSIRVS